MRHTMRRVPEEQKVTVAQEDDCYLSVAGVARVGDRLVCSWRRSDNHTATTTDIMLAYSGDGGRSWQGHRRLAHLDAANDSGMWVAPELNSLPGGRLVIICDRGEHRPGKKHWPSLYDWQQSELGMSNHLFISEDQGETWEGPTRIDDVGGEPERVHQLSSGRWIFTRTEPGDAPELAPPLPPRGFQLPAHAYYRCAAVVSDDDGVSWRRAAWLSDDPCVSDCEVGLAELAPDRLLAVSRIGHAGGGLGQPSRLFVSTDRGESWSAPTLAPFYGDRPIPGLLQSGKVLVTYRHWWGTSGSHAIVFHPDETLPYQPASYIWDEGRCVLADDVLTLTTGDGPTGAVEFRVYPAEDYLSPVTVEAELKVDETDDHGVALQAGCAVRLLPDRICLADRQEIGHDLDARSWHRYRVERDGGVVSTYVDDELAFRAYTEGLAGRIVGFGNHSLTPGGRYERTGSVSHWRSFSAKVDNTRDHALEWSWSAADGYPDQFRRDRETVLDRNGSVRQVRATDDLSVSFSRAHSGYSGWTQLADGTVVIVDYTSGENPEPGAPPFIRAYVLDEKELW